MKKPKIEAPYCEEPWELAFDSVPPVDFADFWDTVPAGGRVAKLKAEIAWKKAIRLESPKTILEAWARFVPHEMNARSKGQRPIHPATWLNGRRWEDELEELATGAIDYSKFESRGALCPTQKKAKK